MKKISSTICMGIIASVLLFPVTAHSQELTEEQKKERCQNNKNRITELETQLRVNEAALSQTLTQKEIEDFKKDILFLKAKLKRENSNKIIQISKKHNFSFKACEERNKSNPNNAGYMGSTYICLSELQKIIETKIDKAKGLKPIDETIDDIINDKPPTSNSRPELINKKNEIEKQIAFHKNNIIALGCNEASAKWNGTFTDSYGSVTITSSGTSMSASFTSQGPEDNWKNVGQWTNCKVEGNTAKCDWSCSYSDNNKTGTRNGRLEVTLSGNTISGSSFEETPASAFNWKPGITDKYTKMGKGAVWPINMKRK